MGNQVIVSSSQAVSPAIGNEQIDFIHSLGRDALHTLEDTGSIRSSALFLAQIDFSPAVLRSRLGRSLAAKGLEGVIQFDQQLDAKLLLKAIWLVDTQRWTEVANALRLAAQRRFCQLPVNLTVQDMERHPTKQVRVCLADVRVIALWKLVGRHVNFGGNSGRFELFDQPGGGVRAIKDKPGYELDINPPPPPRPPIPHTRHQRQPPRQILTNGR
ncbi:unnamed protein product [Vitrella brassicaformis CCMP3155]|uniref:Uncharacterized protein n=1 Tax=Vitrella brassicaformis (strain CCMP3155) TaxID=1169540 RepID=A0A0G4FT20_VITBC|nr:unnamed protein product [Vitrella brassicaformis CCMP3155]|eukprot:CEM17825.1 unnamed protein product [Vitrella brassicaformis CCMP3155]